MPGTAANAAGSRRSVLGIVPTTTAADCSIRIPAQGLITRGHGYGSALLSKD